jgi:hypothetical protein
LRRLLVGTLLGYSSRRRNLTTSNLTTFRKGLTAALTMALVVLRSGPIRPDRLWRDVVEVGRHVHRPSSS